ncbi:hypothetical protein ACIQ9R_35970 [Streptomyces sp. NPDC094447]|uniref:hypothetical protein n=1 Tax=Streptomyces sp. NPDC094447 TaxID=3366062 RepID=UPI00382BEE80
MQIEHHPLTGEPVAVHHETATGWGQQLLEQHGLDELKREVYEEMVDDPAWCRPDSGTVGLTVTTEGDVTMVTAWSRCTRPACVAYAAALTAHHVLPFGDGPDCAPALPAVLAATGAQLDAPIMQFGSDPDAGPLVWAYRTGVLREAAMYLSWGAQAHTRDTAGPAEDALRAAHAEARTRADDLGLDLTDGPVGLTRLDHPDVWEALARPLLDIYITLAAAAQAYATQAEPHHTAETTS